MRLLKTIFTEIWGLFVDDGLFALAVVVWIAIAALAAHTLGRAAWIAPAFFAGLVLILAAGALRQARRTRK